MAILTKRLRTVLLPERTVDSLFAYELLSAAPKALIWSPANNHRDSRGLSPDHLLTVPGFDRQLVVECKTIYARDPDAEWFVRIDRNQLEQYARLAPGTLYLLPADSRHRRLPWASWGCCTPAYENCAACQSPRARRWGWDTQPAIAAMPRHIGFQPWFSHWSWCITARQLQRHFDATGRDIPAADANLQSIAGAQRFCHLLDAIALDATGRPRSDDSFPTELAVGLLNAALDVSFAELLPDTFDTSEVVTRTLTSYRSYRPEDVADITQPIQ